MTRFQKKIENCISENKNEKLGISVTLQVKCEYIPFLTWQWPFCIVRIDHNSQTATFLEDESNSVVYSGRVIIDCSKYHRRCNEILLFNRRNQLKHLIQESEERRVNKLLGTRFRNKR